MSKNENVQGEAGNLPQKGVKLMKSGDLVGAGLDWAVAICKGIPPADIKITAQGSLFRCLRDEDGELNGRYMTGPDLLFSRKWEAGGPIIERERLHVCPVTYNDSPAWQSWVDGKTHADASYGETYLIAAMRCYVTSKLGEQIEVPAELA